MVTAKRRKKKAEDRDKRKIDEMKKEKKTCNFKNICTWFAMYVRCIF